MRSPNLLSKEWCDLIFENRNKEYGAYSLRRQAGARYRRALSVIIGAFLLLAVTAASVSIYARHRIKEELQKAEKALEKLPSELNDGYKIKMLATTRQAPTVIMSPGASEGTPVIVDKPTKEVIMGVKGAITFEPDQDLIVTPIVDTTGLSKSTLPISKEKILPTEVIPEMPEFPGGPREFMKWLDKNIMYPRQCVRQRKEGVVLVSFIVGADGYPTDFKIENPFDKSIQNVILNALKRMPQWKPGHDKFGNPTPVMITVPIEFKI